MLSIIRVFVMLSEIIISPVQKSGQIDPDSKSVKYAIVGIRVLDRRMGIGH